MDRREFIKTAGVGAVALGTAAACKNLATEANAPVENLGPEEMPMRLNQNSGDQVGLLGYGCMRWQTTTDENGNRIINQESVNELVDYALAHGVNYFDSAPVYIQGRSERATAIALLRHPRESYFIATKLSNQNGEPTFESGKAMYQRSLSYYETDYIDYYLLHSLNGGAAFKKRFEDTGLMDYLLEEKRLGHIRNLGFSYHGDQKGFDEMMALHDKYHWDFVQIQMNYIDWTLANPTAEYLYKELEKRDIPVVIMEPLLGGQLSNVPDAVAAAFKQRAPQASVASWAFRFVGSFPRVLTVLSGMTYMEHLQDNLNTYLHFKPLNDEEFELLRNQANLIRNYPRVDCTACQYCMPCPYGIDIPGIFTYYNKAINEGTVPQNSDQENYRRLRKKYLAAYNRAIPTIRQADHCIGCEQCMPHCPQRLRIPRELQRIDAYMEKLKKDLL